MALRGPVAMSCCDWGTGGLGAPLKLSGRSGGRGMLWLRDLNNLCCFYPEEGRRLTLWSQMPDLPDRPKPNSRYSNLLGERRPSYSPLPSLIKNYVPCQPNIGCCSDASPDSGEETRLGQA